MLSKVFRISVFVTVIIICITVKAKSAIDSEKQSLKGIPKLLVLVEKIDPEIENETNITRNIIETDVKLKLRMAGIKVIDYDKVQPSEGFAFIYVTLDIIKINELLYTYSIEVRLQQHVRLNRNDELTIATTWHSNFLGYVGTNRVNTIRDRVKDQIDDEFINDYLEMNPK